MLTAKILLAAECLWFASGYLREHVREEYRPVMVDVKGADDDEERGIYGVGFEADSGFFFWFHSRIENPDGY